MGMSIFYTLRIVHLVFGAGTRVNSLDEISSKSKLLREPPDENRQSQYRHIVCWMPSSPTLPPRYVEIKQCRARSSQLCHENIAAIVGATILQHPGCRGKVIREAPAVDVHVARRHPL